MTSESGDAGGIGIPVEVPAIDNFVEWCVRFPAGGAQPAHKPLATMAFSMSVRESAWAR